MFLHISSLNFFVISFRNFFHCFFLATFHCFFLTTFFIVSFFFSLIKMNAVNPNRVVLYERRSRPKVRQNGRKRSCSTSSSSRGISEILYIVKLNYIYIYIKYVCRTYDNTSTTIFY